MGPRPSVPDVLIFPAGSENVQLIRITSVLNEENSSKNL